VTQRTLLTARAVLFDWDGTLLDSFRADNRAYHAMFSALGVDWTDEDLARHYHPDWYRVYRAARIERSRWDEADRLWREAYARESPALLPGARSILRSLAKRFTLGLVTSGDGSRVRLQLKTLGLGEMFQACVCSEDAARRKPHPAPLRRALSILELSPEECVYVGDSPQDIEMAKRARVRAIGVLGPFPTEHGLRSARPLLLLKSVEELGDRLRPLQKKLSHARSTSAQKPRPGRARAEWARRGRSGA